MGPKVWVMGLSTVVIGDAWVSLALLDVSYIDRTVSEESCVSSFSKRVDEVIDL
jgi:hypothetical protein